MSRRMRVLIVAAAVAINVAAALYNAATGHVLLGMIGAGIAAGLAGMLADDRSG